MSAIAEPVPESLLTYEQYLEEFATQPPTMQPYEIIEGVRQTVNSPLLIHQIITLNLAQILRMHPALSGKGIVVVAPFDVVIRRLPRLKVRQPDVLFLSQERLEQSGGVWMQGPLEVAPELVVEILSPNETPRTIRSKIEDFRSIGVTECWIVGPDSETVQVLRLTSDGIETVDIYGYEHTFQSLAFPELTITVADIFLP